MTSSFPGTFRYFGRRGTAQIYEIYRLPASVQGLSLDDTLKLERLRKDGSWIHNPKDDGVWREMASGWFDGDDEITAEDAAALVEHWRKTRWPGRE